ncbi:MAG: hypothetical protein ACOCW1_02505 [Chitinispirillaceae bacterium]
MGECQRCHCPLERCAIEIRLVDEQECPEADPAVVAAVMVPVKALCEERFSFREEQKRADTLKPEELLYENVEYGHNCVAKDKEYLHLPGMNEDRCTSKQYGSS